jgi:hypothetical protein
MGAPLLVAVTLPGERELGACVKAVAAVGGLGDVQRVKLQLSAFYAARNSFDRERALGGARLLRASVERQAGARGVGKVPVTPSNLSQIETAPQKSARA